MQKGGNFTKTARLFRRQFSILFRLFVYLET